MSDYLTVIGLARVTGRTPKAIQKMVERHQIPFRKHGKRVVFKRSEIEKFFDTLPGVSVEEARQRVEEHVGRVEA
jgi:excisionase family DNA binding protein